MKYLIRYLPIEDKENAGPRIIIFSTLLLILSFVLFISNINFLLDPSTPFLVNASNFLIWGIIVVGFFYTKNEKKMQLMTVITLSISIVVLFGELFITGGLFSADTSWAIVMILVAYLFSGIPSGIVFTVLSLSGFVFYYYGEKTAQWTYKANKLISDPDYVFSTLSCATVVLSLLLMAFVKTLNTLQKKNQELMDAKVDELSMMLESRSREVETLRNKLARDFHDQTGSKLVLLKSVAEMLKDQTDHMPESLREKVMIIEKNAGELYAHTRDFIWSIDSRNSGLDEILLHLSDFGNSFFTPLEVDFDTCYNLHDLREHVVPVEHVMQLILLFKEAMTNSGKYAKCNKVVLSCEVKQEYCRIALKDDGKGFVEKDIIRKSGLRNIEERSKSIGAMIEIESSTENGTTVSAFYPLLLKLKTA